MADKPSKLKIADREFTSRLLVGTGKFASNELMRDALIASGTELVTVALRRADISGKHDPFANILDFIDPKRFLLLPNTSGARNADEAVRFARLAASAGLPTWIKLEIHPDPRYLLPDPVETLAAADRFDPPTLVNKLGRPADGVLSILGQFLHLWHRLAPPRQRATRRCARDDPE